MKQFAFLSLVLLMACPLHAADVPGALDTSFNPTGTPPGTATVAIGEKSHAHDVAIQQDGKIVLVGTGGSDRSPYIALARFAADGVLDPDFQGTGTLTASFVPDSDQSRAFGIALQQDGKIVVAGQDRSDGFTFGVARFNTNGSLDDSFNTIGTTTTRIGNEANGSRGSSVAIQTDGKIVVAGLVYDSELDRYLFGVARFNTDGLLDTSFGVGSGTDIPGTLVVPGAYTIYNDGTVRVALQHDGKIILVAPGEQAGKVIVTRLNSVGLLDTDFGQGGVAVLSGFMFGQNPDLGLAIQQDGKIIVCGTILLEGSPLLTVARLNSNGVIDTSFNGAGSSSTFINNQSSAGLAVAIQPDNKIVAAGFSISGKSTGVFGVARFNSDGTLDTTFNPNGLQPGTAAVEIGSESIATGVAIQEDGKIVLGGVMSPDNGPMAVARLFGDGGAPSGNDLFTQRLIAKYSGRV